MAKSVISVEHLTKQYDLGLISSGTLARDLSRWWARVRGKEDPFTRVDNTNPFLNDPGESILALDDVNFKVEEGQALGIIGRNGAGKSTLLKILSRVTAPTSGVVKIKGRIGSLLEVGTGFHPELTGRENVFLNGAILGMSKAEVQRKFDEIVDFSGVEKFIDTPVKRYSSGMYVRLAFAVAAHLDPEILIVDEVLAVGDAEFQKKCLGKMGDVAGEGRTVLFVSHNMNAIESLCDTSMLLNQGKVAFQGETKDVITYYLHYSRLNQNSLLQVNCNEPRRKGPIIVSEWNIEDNINRQPNLVSTGSKATIKLYYSSINEIEEKYDNVTITTVINDMYGKPILGGSTFFSGSCLYNVPSKGIFTVKLEKLMLMPGSYSLHFRIAIGGIESDYVEDAGTFDVIARDYFGTGKFPDKKHGYILADPTWGVEKRND